MKKTKHTDSEIKPPLRIEGEKVIPEENAAFTSSEIPEIWNAERDAEYNKSTTCKTCGYSKPAWSFEKNRLTCRDCRNEKRREKAGELTKSLRVMRMFGLVSVIREMAEERGLNKSTDPTVKDQAADH
jgi:predicted nucleic-acid-binding Zn-ribbon protein